MKIAQQDNNRDRPQTRNSKRALRSGHHLTSELGAPPEESEPEMDDVEMAYGDPEATAGEEAAAVTPEKKKNNGAKEDAEEKVRLFAVHPTLVSSQYTHFCSPLLN